MLGNSKRKTVLPSNDKNFPNGSEQTGWGSGTWVAALTQGGGERGTLGGETPSLLSSQEKLRPRSGRAVPKFHSEVGAGRSQNRRVCTW